MSLQDDLGAAYAAALAAGAGDSTFVAGAPVISLWESGHQPDLGVTGRALTVRCIAATVPGVAVGDAVVRSGVSYTVRGVESLPPDELEVRLVLERD